MPVILDGSQPQQRHAFSSPLTYVISVELTDFMGLSSVSLGIVEVMVGNPGEDRKSLHGWMILVALRLRYLFVTLKY